MIRKILVLSALLFLFRISFASIINGSINIGRTQRTYHLFVPDNLDSSKVWPVVFVFHGGGGNGEQIMRFTHFDDLAEQEGFMVMCPDGYDKHWNDGREASAINQSQDDVKFVTMLMDELIAHYHADAKRIFITGISNGGIFSLYLLQQIPERLAGVAAVCASIPQNEINDFGETHTVPLMIMNGTADPIVKYAGGAVLSEESRGDVIGTDAMIQLFTANCAAPDSTQIIDRDLSDGCHATRFNYQNCTGNAELAFIKVYGGGHCWPGAAQYLPRVIIGNTCRDFDATDEIWNFFRVASR